MNEREKVDAAPVHRVVMPVCRRDTNGDGDCERCAKHGGCPMLLFRPRHIDRAVMSDEQIRDFKRSSSKFEYREWLGTIRGWRSPDGRVLIEQVEPA
jgi:hypothetical protein